jgi:hypothetical protein
VASGVVSNAMAPDQPSGGGAGSGPQYVPEGLAMADTGWMQAYGQQGTLADAARTTSIPGFQQSFNAQNSINYDPYLQYANRSGQAYGQTGDMAMGQMGGYGQMAQRAQQQQESMYGAGQQVMNTGFDPQNQLYDRTAQHVQDQVRAGQAARGLGNSPVGGAEENQAMSNFNIDWQNAQLGRQTQALGANVQANQAGIGQGQLYGANQQAALSAGQAGAGYYGQAGQAPMQAQQFVAGQPAAVANQYASNLAGIQQMYGNYQSAAIPYMNAGQGAQQGNYNNAYTANRDMAQGVGQIGTAVGNYAQQNAPNWFGGGGTTGGGNWATGSGSYAPYVQSDYGGNF